MRSREEIWRLRLWVWVPALLFFLANATARLAGISDLRSGTEDQGLP